MLLTQDVVSVKIHLVVTGEVENVSESESRVVILVD